MVRSRIAKPPRNAEDPLFKNPDLYINRELSWIQFNAHVLEEARDTSHPLLERVKFLAIFANNLDEFFMIRVAGLQRQREKGVLEAPPDGLTPGRQIEEIDRMLLPFLEEQSCCWREDLLPRLHDAGIHIQAYHELPGEMQTAMREMFLREIFPILTPLAFDKTHPFPFISNLSLNLAIILKDPEGGRDLFARLKIPTPLFPRLMRVPEKGRKAGSPRQGTRFVFIEDLIAANLDLLFPGLEVIAAYPFRVTRDADIEIEEDEASDLLTSIVESVEMRRRGSPVRVEIDRNIPSLTCTLISKTMGLTPGMLHLVDSPVGMADLMQLTGLDRPDLKDESFVPSIPDSLVHENTMFSEIRKRDILMFHPYESFQPVINFLWQAATDPDVLAIKMTLYRVGANSPVVAALMKARENGKAVAALIELKARFDEENNIGWARALEQAGVHVVYGVLNLKVHAKLCMVVRREKDCICRYVHMSSGNYNATTSRIYTDIGIFTANQEIGADVADLFNSLTGYSRIHAYRKLLVSPKTLREGVTDRIEREMVYHREHGNGHIILKLNALVDKKIITALYRASQAGVRVELQVRGICCLRPGLDGVSTGIEVTSIVGRFLEHARVYYFHNNGEPEVLLGSADLMPRNLDRRVEVLFPVLDRNIRESIIETILPVHLHDNLKARRLHGDGTYERIRPGEGGEPLSAQAWCIEHRGVWQYDS
jgi:polyphosphate kinase